MAIDIRAKDKKNIFIADSIEIYKDGTLFGIIEVDEDAPGYLTLTSPDGTKYDVTYHKAP